MCQFDGVDKNEAPFCVLHQPKDNAATYCTGQARDFWLTHLNAASSKCVSQGEACMSYGPPAAGIKSLVVCSHGHLHLSYSFGEINVNIQVSKGSGYLVHVSASGLGLYRQLYRCRA